MKNLFLPKFSFALIASFITASLAYSQGVGINPTGSAPDPSALLDLNASPDNNKGLLLPRLTSEERDAIDNPAVSLMIYNTTTSCFETYIDGGWRNIWCYCLTASAGIISGTPSVCEGENG